MNPLIILALIPLLKEKKTLVFIGVLVIVWVFFFKSIVNTVWNLPSNVTSYINGLLDKAFVTQSDITDFENETEIQKYFDSQWYLERVWKDEINRDKTISSASSVTFANRIYNARGVFNDNENEIYNVIASIPNRMSLSFIAHQFKGRYGENMLNFLKSFLNPSELLRVYELVVKKPIQ